MLSCGTAKPLRRLSASPLLTKTPLPEWVSAGVFSFRCVRGANAPKRAHTAVSRRETAVRRQSGGQDRGGVRMLCLASRSAAAAFCRFGPRSCAVLSGARSVPRCRGYLAERPCGRGEKRRSSPRAVRRFRPFGEPVRTSCEGSARYEKRINKCRDLLSN